MYHDEVLFEFKKDVNLSSLGGRAKVLAQILYYIYRLKFEQVGQFTKKRIPPFLCLADRNEAMLTETAMWKDFYSGNYDWDLQPSSPDPRLVEDLKKSEAFRSLETYQLPQAFDYTRFVEKLQKILDQQMSLTLGDDKKIITEDNFEEVFGYWDSIFHDDVENGLKSSRYFVCDIQAGRSEYSEMKGGVNFYIDDSGKTVFKSILKTKYDKFWSIYEKITNTAEIDGILAKIDRLTDDTLRRFEGQFFTPLDFAKKGLKYLEKELGKNWYKNYKVWDMCAGTGNLEWYIPSDYYHNVYVSTLDEDEVEHMRRALCMIPSENVFRYDYLNDDVDLLFTESEEQKILAKMGEWKLPQHLRDELADPKNKWVILINPPYATSTNYGETAKDKVSTTRVREQMSDKNLGNSSQELFCQFLFRIEREFGTKNATLAMFSTLKYVNSPANQKFRENLFNFSFKRGFIFSSLNFTGNRGKFPVGFLIWNLKKRKPIEKQNLVVDIFESTIKKFQMVCGSAVKIGQKKLQIFEKDDLLNKWVSRPQNTEVFPPLSSAIKQYSAKVRIDRISKNGFGYIYCGGNDFQTAPTQTSFLCAPYGNANGWSIDSENFEQSMVVHAVRRMPLATWINDRDQFCAPAGKLPDAFVRDCVVWSLFSGSNQTSSLKNVEYKNQIFQIKNEFFPFLSAAVQGWEIQNSDLKNQISIGDRYVAGWIKKTT